MFVHACLCVACARVRACGCVCAWFVCAWCVRAWCVPPEWKGVFPAPHKTYDDKDAAIGCRICRNEMAPFAPDEKCKVRPMPRPVHTRAPVCVHLRVRCMCVCVRACPCVRACTKECV